MRVFVKNRRGIALMPCTCRKARLLIKQKKARVVSHDPFTIQMLIATGEARQQAVDGADVKDLRPDAQGQGEAASVKVETNGCKQRSI